MDKTTRIGAIVGGLLALISSLGVIVFLILGLCGVFGLDSESANQYHIMFVANEITLYDQTLTRGSKIETDFIVPGKPDDNENVNYRFIGWDTNGDNIINPVPTRAYRSFTAVAIYVGTRIAPVNDMVAVPTSYAVELGGQL